MGERPVSDDDSEHNDAKRRSSDHTAQITLSQACSESLVHCQAGWTPDGKQEEEDPPLPPELISTPSKSLFALPTATRARASSWSLFRRCPVPQEEAPNSLPSSPQPNQNLLPNFTSLLSNPSDASKDLQDSPLPNAFSLSSIASALKKPLSLTTLPPPRLQPIASSSASSPTSPRPTPLISPRETDPDPTPSVPPPPRLVVESSTVDEEPAAGPFDFNAFLEQMRWPQAEPVAKYLRSFLKEFTKRAHDPSRRINVTEQIKVVNDFLDFISLRMREIKGGPWDPRVCNEAEFDHAVEAMEKLVMNRVWNLTFTPALINSLPSQTDDLERDTVLAQKMNLFYWISDRHLDLNLPPDEADGFLEFAKTELLKINSYKAPRDKMICILNCCKVIFGLIRHMGQNEGSADFFVPVLILVVLRAQPRDLIANVQYIQRFRNPDKMQGENGYYLSSLNAAISFIEKLEHSVLSNITQSEFEYNVEQAISRLPRSPEDELSSSPAAELTAGQPNKLVPATSLPDLTRSWLFTAMPQLAEAAVSKPLNAIARIVDDLSSDPEESDGNLGLPRHHHPHRRTSLQEFTTAGPSGSEHQARFAGRRRGSRPWSTSSPKSIPNHLDSSSKPSEQDFQQIDQLKRAEHQAKLETLSSIFPKLESEVLEIVLITHHGQISKAIDSLLEMSE